MIKEEIRLTIQIPGPEQILTAAVRLAEEQLRHTTAVIQILTGQREDSQPLKHKEDKSCPKP